MQVEANTLNNQRLKKQQEPSGINKFINDNQSSISFIIIFCLFFILLPILFANRVEETIGKSEDNTTINIKQEIPTDLIGESIRQQYNRTSEILNEIKEKKNLDKEVKFLNKMKFNILG